MLTPLFVVLLVVEFTDLIFAVDSVPAIFAITKRSIHRFLLQYIRHYGLAVAVLPADQHHSYFPLPENRAQFPAYFHWSENDGTPLFVTVGLYQRAFTLCNPGYFIHQHIGVTGFSKRRRMTRCRRQIRQLRSLAENAYFCPF